MIGTAHPWHDIPSGNNIPHEVNAVIEIAAGSRIKYELDKSSGLLRLDRILFSAVYYPTNYGLIPQTYHNDGDPLDILVISSEQLISSSLVTVKIVGMMKMTDGGTDDNKIIAVVSNDISLEYIKDIDNLPLHTIQEFRSFFEDYKKLEGKKVSIGNFTGKAEAYACIMESISQYNTKIKPILKHR